MERQQTRKHLEDERARLVRLRDERSDAAELDEAQQDASGTLADYDQHPGDVGSETFERSREISIRDQVETRLEDVEHALEKLEQGTYGRCEVCGNEIDPDRLEARPATRFCKEHQEAAERADRLERGMGEEAAGPS